MSSSSYSSTSSWISTRNSADSPSGYDFIASVSTLSFAGPVRRLQSLYDEWRQLWSSDNPNAEKIWQSVEFNSVHRSVTKFLGDTDLDDKLSPTEDTTSVCLRSLFHFYCDFVSENDGLFCEAGWDILMNTLLGMRAISSHYHLLETIPDATDLLKNTPKLWLTLWKHRCAMVAYSYEDNGREYSFMWLLTDTVLGVANLIFHCGGIPPWGSTDFVRVVVLCWFSQPPDTKEQSLYVIMHTILVNEDPFIMQERLSSFCHECVREYGAEQFLECLYRDLDDETRVGKALEECFHVIALMTLRNIWVNTEEAHLKYTRHVVRALQRQVRHSLQDTDDDAILWATAMTMACRRTF